MRPEAVPRDQIVQELKAAVGDRVLVMPALADTNQPDQQADNAPDSYTQGAGELQPKPPPDPRVRATVVGYDAAADAYLVRDCAAAASAHECNHTLGWSARR
eukprot:SAG11_NODE_7258_length_1171_cov_3.605410_1_plen_101_part_01